MYGRFQFLFVARARGAARPRISATAGHGQIAPRPGGGQGPLAIMSELRVLFMHGLDSRGPLGRKAKHLQHHFPNTLVPQMQVSPIDPLREQRSVTRWVLPYLLASMAVAARQPTAARGLAAAAAAAVGLVPFLRWRVLAAVDSCAALQAAAIVEFQPDVVVGSSWGGRVALRCMELGHWSGPAVLLAPAVGLKGALAAGMPGWDPAAPESLANLLGPQGAAAMCLVVMGEQDTLVSPEAVEAVCRRTGIKIEMVQNGDHRLNIALGMVKDKPAAGRLAELVEAQVQVHGRGPRSS